MPRHTPRVRVRALLAAAVLAALSAFALPSQMAVPAGAQQPGTVLSRISGADPIVRSAAVAQRFTVDTDTVVIARADTYPDALAGAPLARLRNAPILLVPQTAPLPQVIFNQLDRLDPARAIILGGHAAVDATVEQALLDMGIAVERIGGPTRFHTAALLADRLVAETGATRAYVVRGSHPSPTGGWPDAVAVSALAAKQGRPILLTDGTSLNDPLLQSLDRGLTAVDVVGGRAAVADDVLDALRATGREVARISGDSRYSTSAAVAAAGFADGAGMGHVFLVSGGNFADALVTAGPAADVDGTMLFVDPRGWPTSAARDLILSRFGEVQHITVVGSADEIPVRIDHELVDRITGRPAVEVPADAVRIEVGQDIQQVVSSHPPGTTFVIAAGTHRGQQFFPRSGDRFIGEPGAVLNGGVPLDPARAGVGAHGIWVMTAPAVDPGPVDPAVEMLPGREREAYPNELWADHVRLRHVNSPAELTEPGTWYYSYETAEIFTYDDPRALPRPLEVSVTPEAVMTGSGIDVRDVVIRNLTFTHYANRPSRGVLDLGDAVNWDVGNVTVIDNHAVGVRTGPGLHLHDSRIVRNGQMGIVGTDTDFAEAKAALRIERNEVAFNGELGFDWGWEGGSIKFGGTEGTRLIGNWVHNHPGPGPWMDEFGFDTVFAENLVEHNGVNGLMHEISTDGAILDNTIRYNGLLAFGDLGSGVWISNSDTVEVAWNTIEGNRLPINAQTSIPQEGRPAMPIQNLTVHHNDMRIDHLLPGMRVTSDQTYVYDDESNVFADNRYRVRFEQPYQFWWGGTYDIPAWQAGLGFDVNGEFVDITEPARTWPDRPSFRLIPFGAS